MVVRYSAKAGTALQAHPLVNRLNRSSTNGLPPGPMSALGGSGCAAPKEEGRVWPLCDIGQNPLLQ